MKLNAKQTFLTAASMAVLLAAGAGCSPSGGKASRYETMAVSQGNMAQHVTASGTLSALVSVDVGSQVSGKIIALKVDYNSPVQKGQLIAEIDPVVYEASLRQAEGELASAKATATLKTQNLERKQKLEPQRAASKLDLDQATAELAQAQATVIIKQAALDSAKANLGYCKITAPVDGVVIARKVDVGQTVIAAMSTPVLFTLAQDLTKMNIAASVSEADIGQVKEGQPVDFTVDAFPEEVFHGQVAQVRKSPTTTQNVVTYETLITVDNQEQKLFPGMTADVSILVAERHNAVKIPNAALRYVPPEKAVYEKAPPKQIARNQRLVYMLGATGNQLRPVVIKTGISDGSDTEVVSGLTNGAAVVTSTIAAGKMSTEPGGPPPQTP